MQALVLAALTAVIGCRLVQCGTPCATYINSLEEIHQMLHKEDDYHDYSMYHYGGTTFVSRTRYILQNLNADLKRAKANNFNSYNSNKYHNQQGSAKPVSGCKQLEDVILAKSKEFGIEKIGLESNLERLKKLLEHQDNRSSFFSKENEECQTREQECEVDKTDLKTKIEAFDKTRAQLNKTIKSLNDTVNKLQNEKKILLAKLNANAPAIHGETGMEYPASGRDANSATSFSTTETSVTVQNVTSAEADGVAEPSSAIPDIDLRSDAS